MEKITKKAFIDMHSAGKLRLLQGMVKKSKEDIYESIKNIPDIEKYLKPVSGHGNLTNEKNGSYTITIFKKGSFIFKECIMDNSKDVNCSWDTIEIYNTIYYKKD